MSGMRKAIGGSIHRIREFELEKVNLIDEFDILQIVGEGWFGKILLTEHRSTQTEMVLKALPKAYTGISDFFREFHYGLHLAAHRNIITTYDVAFETAGFYVFSQEYAPLGDLTSNVTDTGLGELHAKRVARQLAAAVHHIHSRELVHRDIKLDNILVFRSDFSRIKLCDFGETRRVNTVVRRHNEWLPYSPPEVLHIDTDETYKARTSHDVWQFGIVLFVCLTGCLPWQKAALDDPRYTRYQNWHNATLNIAKKPKLFQLISSRAQRMFKRLLDPKAEKRPATVLEVNKYLEDRWLAKLGAEKALNGGVDERDELCPSMYSFHSSLEEKNQLLHTLTTYGIETTVDRSKKKDRIRQWIQSSAIAEEKEEDESDMYEDEELCEDEDRDNDESASEVAGPVLMKGRHFPERRPNDPRRKTAGVVTTSESSAAAKHVERKIPFAPQVAEERETIARYASFPNGDPNLAIARNGNDRTHHPPPAPSSNAAFDSPPTADRSTVDNIRGCPAGSDGRNAKNAADASAISAEDESASDVVASEYSPPRAVCGAATNATRQHTAAAVGSSTSPQIPVRKNRAHTVPFSDAAASARSTADRRGESERRAQSAGVSRTSQAEEQPVTFRAPTRTSVSPHPLASSDVTVVAVLSPTTTGKAGPGDAQTTPTSALTMPIASHFVMQSFNTLRGIANSGGAWSGACRPGEPMEKTNVTYGKDAYEHYGIAHGAVLPARVEVVRQDSNGSGSRSASN